MGIIWDLSKWQPSDKIDWAKAAKEVDLCIIRVQYGSKTIDSQYKEHVANCKKYNIPFGSYAYGMFISVNDAIKEANDFMDRADKDSEFLVLDTEHYTVNACGTKNVAVASQKFIDTLKAKGHKTGFYVSHELFDEYGLDKVKADFKWLPRYGKDNGKPDLKPNFSCDLWQYSQNCKADFYKGGMDFSLLNGNKTIDWFIAKHIKKQQIKKVEEKIMGLSDAQNEMVKRLKDLKITDGKNPQNPVNNLYTWSLINSVLDIMYKEINDIKKQINDLKK